jgi:HK97 family phage prohead protease
MKELKRIPIEFDAKAVKDDGAFAGYASTFGNVDSGYDVVMPGAFANSLRERPCSQIKMLWQHDWTQPIGIWTKCQEDDKGLYVEGKILRDVQRGAEAYTLMKAGAIDSMSIGFKTLESDYTSAGVRQLKEVGLMEISLVTFAMNEQATVTAVKDFNPRELEKALRDAGLAGRDAVKAVAIFKERLRDAGNEPAIEQRDADPEATAALAAQLRRFEASLRA